MQCTFEVMRDCARRTVTCPLGLFAGAGRFPCVEVTCDLHRLWLDSPGRDNPGLHPCHKTLLVKANSRANTMIATCILMMNNAVFPFQNRKTSHRRISEGGFTPSIKCG